MRYLEKSFNTFLFTIAVPIDLREAVGVSRIRKSLKTGDPVKAQALAFAHAERTKAQFAELRKAKTAEASRWEELKAQGQEVHAEAVWEELQRRDGEQHPIGEEDGRTVYGTFDAAYEFAQVVADNDLPSGLLNIPKRVRLEPYIGRYAKRASGKPKTVAEKLKAVREFVAEFKTLEAVTRSNVTEYFSDNGKKTATNVKELRFVGAFLDFATEEASRDRVDLSKLKLFAQEEAVIRQALPLADIVALHRGASDLAVVVKVLYLTGMRLGEVMNDTTTIEPDGFNVVFGKTQNARRWVPRHSAITADEIENLRRLRAATKPNKYGQKTKRASQELNRQINALGLGKEYVLHSIRKSTVTALHNAGLQEAITAQLVGHRIPTMTYDLYSGGVDKTALKEAVDLLEWPES